MTARMEGLITLSSSNTFNDSTKNLTTKMYNFLFETLNSTYKNHIL